MLCVFFATEINFLIAHHQNWIHRISHIDDCKTDTKNWYQSQGNTKNRENPKGGNVNRRFATNTHPTPFYGRVLKKLLVHKTEAQIMDKKCWLTGLVEEKTIFISLWFLFWFVIYLFRCFLLLQVLGGKKVRQEEDLVSYSWIVTCKWRNRSEAKPHFISEKECNCKFQSEYLSDFRTLGNADSTRYERNVFVRQKQKYLFTHNLRLDMKDRNLIVWLESSFLLTLPYCFSRWLHFDSSKGNNKKVWTVVVF